MRIGLTGPSYQQASLPFDAQRSINLYPVQDNYGKETSALYGTPGLVLLGTLGTGPIRGIFTSTQGRTFAVSGSQLYEFFGDGTSNILGSLSTSSGTVQIDENTIQLIVCDGETLYTLTYSTNVFAPVTSSGLLFNPVGFTVIDGYCVVSFNNSGQFQISSINDATTYNGLDYATAQSSPDNLYRVMNAVGQLWLLGEYTTEIWTDRGSQAFPFAKIAGAKFDVGILAPNTCLPLDNSIFWVGQDTRGVGIVYRANGFAPQRISTETVEIAIQAATDPTNMRAWTYQQHGHVFYAITGGGLTTTWVYDIATQLWHERAYLDSFGDYETSLVNCCCAAYQSIIGGDRTNGNIYKISTDAYDDNGNPLVADRIYTHIFNEDIRQRFSQLIIGFETGVGTETGQGAAPQVGLRISKDGGRTWSNEYFTSIGQVGQYQARAVFRRLSITPQMTFRLRITDPVKRAIIGSYLR